MSNQESKDAFIKGRQDIIEHEFDDCKLSVLWTGDG